MMCSPVWQDPVYLKLWMYCLMKASHKEREQLVGNQVIKLMPGEFVTGRTSLSDDLNKGMKPKLRQSESTWWRYLNNLELWGMLNIKKTTKYSVVSIVKWADYQESEQDIEHQLNNKRTTIEHQLNTNKNVNNVKNEKKNKYAEFVSMTQSEYEKLLEQFGEQGTKDRIENLNLYKGSKGVKYKNDYLTILAWERKNSKPKKQINWEDL